MVQRGKQNSKRAKGAAGGGPCNCCALSRRGFVGLVAASAAVAAAKSAFSQEAADEIIDLASLRPRPEVRILGAVVRQEPPYWLGWPGTSYPLEAERERYTRIFAESAERAGVKLEMEPQPLESKEAVAEFIKKIEDQKPQAVFTMTQHLDSWPALGDIAKAGVPMIVFSPVGTSFTQHVKKLAFEPGVHVISSLETGPVEQALRMVRAKRQFEESRLLVVKDEERKEEKMDRLGVLVKRVPRTAMEEMFAQVPETDEAKEIAQKRFAGAQKVVEPTKEDGINAARSFIAAKRLLKAEGCNALTTDCLGMVSQKKVPTPPCMGASIFQDTGVTYGCEGDVNGALSLMLTSFLFDQPGFMNDPVPETVKNVLIAAHCVSGTRIYGIKKEEHAPYILRSHSESGIGVSPQVLWPEWKKVTLVLMQGQDSMIIDTGTVVGNVQTPPAGGCRTSVEIAMDHVEDCRDVRGFHQVVFFGDHRRELEAFCQMYGIKPIHSPRTHEEAVARAQPPKACR
jgi:nucleotide-binding universal stress UspA family protein